MPPGITAPIIPAALLPPPQGYIYDPMAHPAESMMAEGDLDGAATYMPGVADSSDPNHHPLLMVRAMAFRQSAARFATQGIGGQHARLFHLDEAAHIYQKLEKRQELLQVLQAMLRAHLALGDLFPTAVAARHVMILGLAHDLLGQTDILKLAHLLAEYLEKTIAAVRANDEPTHRAVAEDEGIGSWDHGRLIGVSALAYRISAEGPAALRSGAQALFDGYRESADRHFKLENVTKAMMTLGQGILLGQALGLRDAFTSSADRLVSLSAADGNARADAAMREAITLSKLGKRDEARQLIQREARVVLAPLPDPLHLQTFFATLDAVSDGIVHAIERGGWIRVQPASDPRPLMELLAIAKRQFGLWDQALTAVLPLAGPRNDNGLEKWIDKGLAQLVHWQNVFNGAVSSYIARSNIGDLPPDVLLKASRSLMQLRIEELKQRRSQRAR